LYIQARQCGLSRQEFGRLTIRELFREFVVAKEQRWLEAEARTVQAYQTVLIYFAARGKKRMPKIDQFLPKRETGPQDAQQLKSTLTVMAAQYGIPLRKAKRSA
jgi:hypothetical protein